VMWACFEGDYGLGSLASRPLYWVPSVPMVNWVPSLPIELPYWGLNPLHCYPRFPGLPILGMLTEGEFTFTHIYGMELTDEISGKSTSESNHTLKDASSISFSDMVLFKLN